MAIVAGSNAVPLTDLIGYQDRVYSLDRALIRLVVDSSSAGDTRYTPSNAKREARKLDTQSMYQSWQKAYRSLKKQHPNVSDVTCSKRIAKMDIAQGRDADTIRKSMTT